MLPALFHGENHLPRNKNTAVHPAERLKQSPGNCRGGRKTNAVFAIVSLNRSTQADRTHMSDQQVLSTQKWSFPLTPVQESSDSGLCVSRYEGSLPSRTEKTLVVRNSSHLSTEQHALCEQRDEGYLTSRNDQLSVVRNADTTAQNSTLCVSRDEGYLVSRTN